MTKRLLTVFGLAMLTSACVTTEPASRNAKADADAKAGGAVNLAGDAAGAQGLRPLENAALPKKSCGMILWTLEGNRPAAVFRFVSGEEGEINIAGSPVILTRTSYDGAGGYGVYERQVFEGADGVAVEVSARFGLTFDGGAYLEHGLIKVRDSNGWSMVAPTAGIAGCKS